MQYEEPLLQIINLGDKGNQRNILVGDNWNLVLKAATFKIFMEYRGVFTWMY